MIIESVNTSFYNLDLTTATEDFPYKTMQAIVEYGRSLGYVFSGEDLGEDPNKEARSFFRRVKDRLDYNSGLWSERVNLFFIKNDIGKMISISFNENLNKFLIRNYDYDLLKQESFNEVSFYIKKTIKLSDFFDKIFHTKTSEKELGFNFLFKRLHINLKNSFIKFREENSGTTMQYKHSSEYDKNRKRLNLTFSSSLSSNEIEYSDIMNLFTYDFYKNYMKIINIVEKHTKFILQSVNHNSRNAEFYVSFLEAEKNEKVMNTLRYKKVEDIRKDTINSFEKEIPEDTFSSICHKALEGVFSK